MKKPEKKDIKNLNYGRELDFTAGVENGKILGFNESCEAWEAFLPDVKEIERLIPPQCQGKRRLRKMIAEAFAKRIGKEEK